MRGWRVRGTALLAAALVAAGLSACGAAVTSPAPPLTVGTAGADLARAAGVHYHGTWKNQAGQTVTADLDVLAGGQAVGTVALGAAQARLLAVDGLTFLNAGASFWGAAGYDRSTQYDGVWVEPDTSILGLDVATALTPSTVGDGLEALTATASPVGESETAVPDAGRVARVTSGQAQYDITTDVPYQLVGLDALALPGAGAAAGAHDFALTAYDDGAEGAALIEAGLANAATQLNSALDVHVDFTFKGSINCTVSCLVNVTVTSQAAAPISVAVYAPVTLNGGQAGSCQTTITAIPAGGSATGGCTDTSSVLSTAWNNRLQAEANGTASPALNFQTLISVTALAQLPGVSTLSSTLLAGADQLGQAGNKSCGQVRAFGNGASGTATASTTAPGGCLVEIEPGVYEYPLGVIRTADGGFTGTVGPWVGADAETKAWNTLAAAGKQLVRRQIVVTGDGGGLRIYDGAIKNADGTYTGIAIEGSAARTPQQAAFDAWVTGGGSATGIGQASGETVRGVTVVTAP